MNTNKQFHDGFGNPATGNIRESDGVYLAPSGLPSVLGGKAYEVGKPICISGPEEIGTIDEIMREDKVLGLAVDYAKKTGDLKGALMAIVASAKVYATGNYSPEQAAARFKEIETLAREAVARND